MFPSNVTGHSRWALVNTSDISVIGPVVMNKRTGYVPRVYKDSNYFVKRNNYATIDGTPKFAGTSTLRYFDNIDDAEKYKDQLETAAKAAGEDFDPSDYNVLGDREMTSAELDSEVVGQWGGLYSGYRGDETIKFGLAGTEGARMTAVEAMQDYMQHISTRYPMSQYRMGMEQRWLNHARDIIPEIKTNGFSTNFSNTRGIVESSVLGNSAAKKKLLDSHDQITFMNRTPTIGEEQTAGMLKKVNDSMSRLTIGGVQPLKPLARAMGNLNKSDPIAAAKTAAFHGYLGLFNFSQFFVQGMGASIAMSLSPLHASRGLTKLPGFVILDNIKDVSARKVQIKTFGKKFGDDFEEAYNAWWKSGLHDSALITNADAYTIQNGLPMTNGVFGKALEKGTFFFTAGELVNLRMSFLTSYQKFKAANKGKRVSDTDLKHILGETEKFRLHMTNANKGDFQKGIMSLPTQFLQINVRYMEALLGKELTKTEKAALVLGQASLFGAAGVPFSKYVAEPFLESVGFNLEEMSESDMIKAQRGVFGYLMNDFMDIDAVFSSRVAIGEGVTDVFANFIAGKEVSVPDLLLGPVGGIVDNVSKAFSDAVYVKEGAISSDELSTEDITMMGEVIAQGLLGVPSSTKNIMKAYYLYTSGGYQDKQGNMIMLNTDPKIRDLVAQSLGFGSQDVDDFWELVIDNKNIETVKAEAVNQIMRGYNNMFIAARDNDVKKQRAWELMLSATYSMFPNPKDRDEVLSSVLDRFQNPKSRVDQEIKKHLEWYGTEIGSSANQLIPLVQGYIDKREQDAGNL